ncbi:NYN domain-containing protein [Aggregatilinea lenta]|uniref:NYN domain-containing protein n=1 Tax=Aggregatilinea lenta TaxID=913108 RepID=UPI000E5B0616|nr:NYN domain-containing protein [Aggregatilinea lenta]
MTAYLIVDVDDLLQRLEQRGVTPDVPSIAAALMNSAALAAGLKSPDDLRAVAVADWNRYRRPSGSAGISVQQVFAGEGYELFNVPERKFVTDALLMHYFSVESDPVDELIIATTRLDISTLVHRVQTSDRARVRIWGDEPPPDVEDVIFQPLEAILGIPSKTVALYIDFENISISLSEQGYILDLDNVIEGMIRQAQTHGQVSHMAAYAPWGQRGSLAPLTDRTGREVSDEAPSRMARANIDPVFSLPGKNSADMRIAKEVLGDSAKADSADVFIIASGDRDFNEVFSAVRSRNKQVIVWGVRGSTSRLVESNPALSVEYVEDFCNLHRHSEGPSVYNTAPTLTPIQGGALQYEEPEFRPSQWSSVIVQLDQLLTQIEDETVTLDELVNQLIEAHTVPNEDRAEDLIFQAASRGLLEYDPDTQRIGLNMSHPVVDKTFLIRDRIVHRVANTLHVRGWEYVNYGFLLKGIGMDHGLEGPSLNTSDTWRSEWVDFLVRENILARELVPHRHNPEDLVPVIKLADLEVAATAQNPPGITEEDVHEMTRRVIVSVEQFTSFRGFAWCPLGSLHRRLRPFDPSTTFQQAVEELLEMGAVVVREYENPQSDYKTKGISLVDSSPMVIDVLTERNRFVQILLDLYERRVPISREVLQELTQMEDEDLDLWISIMQSENILKPVPGQHELYSLFRTHHTVSLVAGETAEE